MRKWLALLLCCVGCAPMPQTAPKPERWVAYYDNKLPASTFLAYDLVVFDRRYHPDFDALKGKSLVLAYVSIGEVHGDSPKKPSLAARDALLAKRDHWDSHVVDLGDQSWRDAVLAEVGSALAAGFDGVMLDTVDSPLYYAMGQSKQAGRKAKDDAISLIQEIRKSYPTAKLMLNRGFEILPQVAPMLDFVLAESILSQTDVSTGQSRLFPPHTYHLAVSKLEEARSIAPQLTIYTLDYWNQDDVQGIGKLYATQRSWGFVPYVTTPDLRRHTPEPSRRAQAAFMSEMAYA